MHILNVSYFAEGCIYLSRMEKKKKTPSNCTKVVYLTTDDVSIMVFQTKQRHQKLA